MDRRGFLGSILAAAVAPAIVRADSLMRVVSRDTWLWLPGVAGNYFTTPDADSNVLTSSWSAYIDGQKYCVVEYLPRDTGVVFQATGFADNSTHLIQIVKKNLDMRATVHAAPDHDIVISYDDGMFKIYAKHTDKRLPVNSGDVWQMPLKPPAPATSG